MECARARCPVPRDDKSQRRPWLSLDRRFPPERPGVRLRKVLSMSITTTFDVEHIVHIRGVDHPESIAVGPHGEAYTTGTAGRVYRIDLESNTAEQFAETKARCLGQAVDANGHLYAAHTAGDVLRITPAGDISVYATGPGGTAFKCTNYPAFDRAGDMYPSESGDWSGQVRAYLQDPLRGRGGIPLAPGGRGYPERHRPGRPRATPLLRGDLRRQHLKDCDPGRWFGRRLGACDPYAAPYSRWDRV